MWLLSARGEEGTGSLQGWGVYQAFVLGPLEMRAGCLAGLGRGLQGRVSEARL